MKRNEEFSKISKKTMVSIMNKIIFLLFFSCLIFDGAMQASIPDETTVHTIQGEKVTEPLRSTNSCLRPLIDFSKTGRGAIRVAVFYTIVFCAYHATNWVRERFFGIRPSHEEARAFWYDMLIMGIVIELANKAEGDCGIFNELPSQIPLLN